MLDLPTAHRATLRELDAFADRLAAASNPDWDRPTRCAGWAVRDLAAHMVGVAAVQAEALARSRRGDQEPPAIAAPDRNADRAAILADLGAARTGMDAAFAALTPADLGNPCPLPFATIPGVLAIQLVAAEAGIHGNDLAWALGDEAPLATDVAVAAAAILAAALPMLARAAPVQPPPGSGIDLVGPTLALRFRRDGDGWRVGDEPARPWAEIRGSDSAVLLFAFGRIPIAHPTLTVAGDRDLAAAFKTHFPGP